MATGMVIFIFMLHGILTMTSRTYSTLIQEQLLIVGWILIGTIRFLSSKEKIPPADRGELSVLATVLNSNLCFPDDAMNVSLLCKAEAMRICLELSLLMCKPIGMVSPG